MTSRCRFLISIAASTSALLVASAAAAQEQSGYAVNHFAPAERGSRWFVLDSLDLQGDGRLAIGMVHDYSYRSLLTYQPDGSVLGSLVRNQYVAHLGASAVLADRFRVGVTVPLQLQVDGHTRTVRGVLHRGAEDVAVGDVRLSGDARVFGTYGDAATLAVGLELFLPSGTPSAYTGDGEPRAAPRILFAGESGALAYSARAGVHLRARDEAFIDGYIGHAFTYGASVGLLLADRRILVGPEVFGSTVFSDSRAGDRRTSPAEALLGVHADVGENLRLGAGAGAQLLPGYGAPVARALVSLDWVPGNAKPDAGAAAKKADRDGDGIPDAEDACGWASGPASTDPTKNGCPPPDADHDTVPDDVDACPAAAGPATADAKTNGCPVDSDADGIPDVEDACPRDRGVRSSDPAKNGCPEHDEDGDGVRDSEDACPKVPGVRATDPRQNGCPDPDRDKDGVPNDADACPDQPGKADPDPKKNGCPMAVLDGGVIKIADQVRFKTNSAELVAGKESQDVLEAVAAVLRAHPEVLHLRVEGHTDNQGDPGRNRTLSQARADAVVKWLTEHGIDKSRLASAGFGADRPIEPNTTDRGRSVNRRVEFHVEQGSGR